MNEFELGAVAGGAILSAAWFFVACRFLRDRNIARAEADSLQKHLDDVRESEKALISKNRSLQSDIEYHNRKAVIAIAERDAGRKQAQECLEVIIRNAQTSPKSPTFVLPAGTDLSMMGDVTKTTPVTAKDEGELHVSV